LGLFTNLMPLAFAKEGIYGKSVRIVHAPNYNEYFGYRIISVGRDRFYTATHVCCFTLLGHAVARERHWL